MKERPILFSAPMVKAILSGSKSQTRRVVKPQPPANAHQVETWHHPDTKPRFFTWTTAGEISDQWEPLPCPYGQPGEKLWVRESFARIDVQTRPWIETDYRATYKHGDRLGDTLGITNRWTPSIYMPWHASRITIEVTGVRVERLQDISEADAAAEGITPYPGHPGRWLSEHRPGLRYPSAITAYRDLWEESINGPSSSWDANPWVWVVEFKRVKGGAA